jgi:hypothetical protein
VKYGSSKNKSFKNYNFSGKILTKTEKKLWRNNDPRCFELLISSLFAFARLLHGAKSSIRMMLSFWEPLTIKKGLFFCNGKLGVGTAFSW